MEKFSLFPFQQLTPPRVSLVSPIYPPYESARCDDVVVVSGQATQYALVSGGGG